MEIVQMVRVEVFTPIINSLSLTVVLRGIQTIVGILKMEAVAFLVRISLRLTVLFMVTMVGLMVVDFYVDLLLSLIVSFIETQVDRMVVGLNAIIRQKLQIIF